jgi:ribosomal protein L15E
LFFAIDRAVGAAEFRRGTRFDLDENQGVIVAGHNIHLGLPATRPIISRHDSKAGAAKISMGQILAASAERSVGRERVPLAKLPD